ncbi:hypothetical protein HO173_001760 [Letharia columbiana]|uniref:Uncharacterized protein n=1 Tax=Letharia columbiana TaxID=112416 RepID=A0A8H6L970_9LECA|nr:uncharacterized protein HO173_001760 [Letharia columbiana]KAF6240150.1 hypothetical protein HO173_001760 [Letharia columbiana]
MPDNTDKRLSPWTKSLGTSSEALNVHAYHLKSSKFTQVFDDHTYAITRIPEAPIDISRDHIREPGSLARVTSLISLTNAPLSGMDNVPKEQGKGPAYGNAGDTASNWFSRSEQRLRWQ